MAYTISDPQCGFLPISGTDAGVIPPNNANTGSTTTVPTPPAKAGMIVSATDPTYGGGEFILLLGVSGTAVGTIVTYNTTSYTTTLASSSIGAPIACAVSMSANTSATTWSWYQIAGVAVATKSAVSVALSGGVGITTAGLVAQAATAVQEIQGAAFAAAATTLATTVNIVINRPHLKWDFL